MIEWCNTNAGFVTSLLTLVYVVATLVIVAIMIHGNSLNRKATETAIELERQRSRPVVILEFKQDSIMWTLKIKNLGLSVARNIKFSVSPEPKMLFGGANEVPKEKRERSIPIFQNGMASLAPGSEYSTVIGGFDRMKEEYKGLSFSGDIKYTDETGYTYSTPVEIDLSIYESTTYLSRNGLHEIGRELEKIYRELMKIGSGFSKPRILTQDIHDYLKEQKESLKKLSEKQKKLDQTRKVTVNNKTWHNEGCRFVKNRDYQVIENDDEMKQGKCCM